MAEASEKGELVKALGAVYLDGLKSPIPELPRQIGNLDIVVEATGNSAVAFQAMAALGTNGILCLMGVSAGRKPLEIDAACLNMKIVLGNKLIFGAVSSNRSHFEKALQLLSNIEHRWPGWLGRLITRRLGLGDIVEALHPGPGNIKTVVALD